jgi:hypothetical protein
MRTLDVESWGDFKERITEVRREREIWLGEHTGSVISEPTFRGHASDTWPLTTTLERAGHEEMRLTDYAHYLSRIHSEISAVTGGRFEVPDYPEVLKWHDTQVSQSLILRDSPPGYEFMVYLRQHGYPSPLLDWTASEYVAAYFAFADITSKPSSDRVAIYMYMEHVGGAKMTSSDKPMIRTLGPYAMTHPRHFTQQACYTICLKLNSKQWHYSPHSGVFDVANQHTTDDQDLLYKYTLPVSERKVVMQELLRVNLTPWSLFGTQESLMKTMALKTLEKWEQQ